LDWLVKRPRWHVHYTPTSASWVNQIERFFALLTERQIRRGVHRSLGTLQAAITSFIEQSAPFTLDFPEGFYTDFGDRRERFGEWRLSYMSRRAARSAALGL
jgi:hypothetical protein